MIKHMVYFTYTQIFFPHKGASGKFTGLEVRKFIMMAINVLKSPRVQFSSCSVQELGNHENTRIKAAPV